MPSQSALGYQVLVPLSHTEPHLTPTSAPGEQWKAEKGVRPCLGPRGCLRLNPNQPCVCYFHGGLLPPVQWGPDDP